MKMFQGKNDVSQKAEMSTAKGKVQAAIWATIITIGFFLLKNL